MPAQLRILVVEDERLIAMQLEEDIADAGHQVVGSAMSSAEAIRLGCESQPDLALVDIHLTDGPTGLEVARRLSARDITVVFLTSNAKRIPADFAGAAGVLSKPLSTHSLHQALGFFAAATHGASKPASHPRGLVLAPDWHARTAG